jgi:HEAT repeat protein
LKLAISMRRVAGSGAFLAMLAAAPVVEAQAPATVTFEQTVADLGSENPDVRFRAVQALKQSSYIEAAVPLARTVVDADDAIQLQAIAAELNIFLAEPIVPRKKVALVVEVRNAISAMAIFDQGPGALDPRPVPAEVLTALRTASHDDNPRVSVEALYAFGSLADNAYGRDRQTLLAASAAELAAVLGVPQPDLRAAAVRVIGRLYAWRVGDAAVDQAVGDAIVTALNDRESAIRTLAMQVLGSLRYERGIQALTDAYRHYQRGSNAVAAFSALARTAHSTSVPLFVSALSSKDSSIRLAAVEGLARAGEVSQFAAIRAALASERNQDLLLAGQFADVVLSNGQIEPLVDALTRARLHDRALGYVIDMAPGRAAMLDRHVMDPDAALRIDLATALGLSGDAQAVPIVQRLLKDSDPAVSRAATRAAGRLQMVASPQP